MSEKFYWSPVYRGLRDDWVKHSDIYYAKRNTIVAQPYLYPHEQESGNSQSAKDLYARRQTRTSFLAITRIVVSLLQSLFFRSPIQYDDAAKKMLDGAEDNIDGQGMTLQALAADHVLVNDLLFGYSWILVDAFGLQVRSRGEAQMAGLRPFMTPISPLGVPDWMIETADPKRAGKLNAWRRQYELEVPRENLRTQPRMEVRTDEYLKTAKGFSVGHYKTSLSTSDFQSKKIEDVQWEIAGEDAGIIEIPLPEITVASYASTDWVYDLAEENLRHFNLRSSADNIEYYQAYDKHVFSGEGINDEACIKGLTEYSIGLIPKANVTLHSMPAGDATGLKASIADSLDMCFKLGLNQQRQLPQSSKSVQGADTIAEEKDNTIAAIEAELENLEAHLNEALGYYAQYKGATDFEGEICIDKNISRQSFTEWLAVYNATRDIMRGVKGYEAAVAMKVIRESKFPEKQREELLKEAEKIKNIAANQGADAIGQALAGKPKPQGVPANG